MLRFVVGAALVCVLLLLACGSRTGLALPGAADAAGVPGDAGVGFQDAAVESDASLDSQPGFDVTPVACPGSVPSTPAGQIVWQTDLVTDRYLTGPLAADPQGNTYYVDDGALWGGHVDGGSRVMSLDDCGRLRWNQPWEHYDNGSVGTHVMVSGSRLIASNGDVMAFDLTSGDVLWQADMVSFASQAGIGDLTQSDTLGATAAAADGTVYVVVNTQVGSWVVAIDTSGMPSVLASLPPVVMKGGEATDIILDAAGNLDVPMSFTNVNPGPGQIVSLSRSGQLLATTMVNAITYQDHLMSTKMALVSEDQGIVVGLGGGVVGTLGTQLAAPAVLDGAGVLYAFSSVTSAGQAVSAWAPDLTPLWTTNLVGNAFFELTGGPLLGDGSHVWVLQQVSVSQPYMTAVSAFDRARGTQMGWSFPGESPGFAILVPPGELVFAIGTRAVAISTAGEGPGTSLWPTFRGGNDQRGAAAGQ
jgi:hypothetical protein